MGWWWTERRSAFFGPVLCLLVFAGCHGENGAATRDSGLADAGAPDDGAIDSGVALADGGPMDGGPLDAGVDGATPPVEPLRIYMRVTGSDANPGTEAEPLRTLEGVQTRLEALAPDSAVEVHIAPDRYTNQSVTWTYLGPEGIAFMPWGWSPGDPPPPERPIFDGNGPDGIRNAGFFALRRATVTEGVEASLAFYHLHVRNYVRAGISIAGNPRDAAGWVSTIEIRDNVFEAIGNECARIGCCDGGSLGSAGCPLQGLGAILLQNTRNALVTGNVFVDLVNAPNHEGHVHGLYLSHYSRDVAIELNRFVSISGDPVRVRDEVQAVRIEDNCFARTGAGGVYGDWYQDPSAECAAHPPTYTQECPSGGNVYRNNAASCDFVGGDAVLEFHAHSGTCTPSACTPPPEPRLTIESTCPGAWHCSLDTSGPCVDPDTLCAHPDLPAWP